MRSGILCAGLRDTDANIWSKTVYKYKNSTDKNEKADILAGLGCVSNIEIVQNFLELTTEEDSAIDIFDAMNSICAGNAKSFNILLNFVNNNTEIIQKT